MKLFHQKTEALSILHIRDALIRDTGNFCGPIEIRMTPLH